jgi:hypothetical protein
MWCGLGWSGVVCGGLGWSVVLWFGFCVVCVPVVMCYCGRICCGLKWSGVVWVVWCGGVLLRGIIAVGCGVVGGLEWSGVVSRGLGRSAVVLFCLVFCCDVVEVGCGVAQTHTHTRPTPRPTTDQNAPDHTHIKQAHNRSDPHLVQIRTKPIRSTPTPDQNPHAHPHSLQTRTQQITFTPNLY